MFEGYNLVRGLEGTLDRQYVWTSIPRTFSMNIIAQVPAPTWLYTRLILIIDSCCCHSLFIMHNYQIHVLFSQNFETVRWTWSWCVTGFKGILMLGLHFPFSPFFFGLFSQGLYCKLWNFMVQNGTWIYHLVIWDEYVYIQSENLWRDKFWFFSSFLSRRSCFTRFGICILVMVSQLFTCFSLCE